MKIYLAGPDVFFPDALAHGESLKQLCRECGLEGLYPLDGEGGPALVAPYTPREHAELIYQANIALIRRADALMANVQNFRGHEPDSGTAFEIGFAAALGLPVWLYNAPRDTIVQQIKHASLVDLANASDTEGRDAEGNLIEDFGMPRNLMLMCASRLVEGDARACLQAIRADADKRANGG